jgi:DegV family protein with EDD domain
MVVVDRIDYIDGPCLVRAVVSGSEWVASKRIHLNEINVFPVPDGDTGTNLTMTLKAASDAVKAVDGRPLGEVAGALSRAVIYGARGNAGIIFAQFVRGFAREVQGVEKLYPKAFVAAMRESVTGAYEAMTEPTEGTILTVIRESVNAVARATDGGITDFVALLEVMLAAARESLERTPELLPVLKEAGVVDAGGEGFVDFLEGILLMLMGEEVGSILDSLPSHEEGLPAIQERDLKYRYCTEFMVEGPDVNVADLKVRLAGMGGSVVVVGSPGLVRAHIHTNSPEVALDVAASFGTVSAQKVDDMREQHREFIRGGAAGDSGALDEAEPVLAGESRGAGDEAGQAAGGGTGGTSVAGRRAAVRDRRRRSVRIVTDSTADIPEDVAADLGIVVVPLTVNFEDASLRCGVDLTNDEFYERLRRAEALPTTSQPTPHDFAGVYEGLSWETKAVLSVHISSEMSGTVRSATLASQEVQGVEVRVVDSRLVSAPLGMTVIAAAESARDGAGLAELTTLVSNLSVRARVLFTVGSLDFLVRGGRIGRAKGLLGKLMGVRPILTVEDGVVAPVGKARGEDALLESLRELARPELEGGDGGTLGLIHAQRPEITERVRDVFLSEFGFEDVRVFELGGVVGTHAGPGTWGISYFRRRPAR